MEELREKIDDISKLIDHIKAAGYVQLDEDQALPAGTMTLIGGDNNAQKVITYLTDAGWRKIK